MLPEDELVDIVYSNLRPIYRKEMELLDFDPSNHTLNDPVNFCTRVEESGKLDNEAKQLGKVPRKSSKAASLADPKKRFYCKMHGYCAHTTNECHDIQDMMDTLDRDRKPAARGDNKRPRYGNRKWNRKHASDGDKPSGTFDKEKFNKYKKSPELNAFVLGATKKAVRSELNAFFKSKKKARKEEANAAEVVDLDAFNFPDKLSEDEASVKSNDSTASEATLDP